jgi:hypothetical protein
MSAKAELDLDDKPYTLEELAQRFEPQIYEDWKKELQARRLDALDSGFTSWGRRDAAAYLADVRQGTEFSKGARDERRFNDLRRRLHAAVRDVIALPLYKTTGIGPMGNVIEIPRERANQLLIDIENNTLSTPDGGMIWRAIVVRSQAARLPPQPEKSPQPDDPPLRKVEDRVTLVGQAKAALRLLFPDGNARGSYTELSDRIVAAGGKRFKKDVIRRAVDKKT